MRTFIFLFVLFLTVPLFAQTGGECEAVKEKLAQTEKKLFDWARLSRYADTNRAIQSLRKIR